jgi:hypothetical protein
VPDRKIVRIGGASAGIGDGTMASPQLMLHDALDGGCTASMRFDPLGKSAAQEILDFEVPISAALLPPG